MRFASISYNAAKCYRGRGSAPDPAGRAYSAPPNPLAGPLAAGRGREGREWEGWGERKGEGRRGTGREGKGREGEVESDAQLEQGCQLAKASPDSRNKTLQNDNSINDYIEQYNMYIFE